MITDIKNFIKSITDKKIDMKDYFSYFSDNNDSVIIAKINGVKNWDDNNEYQDEKDKIIKFTPIYKFDSKSETFSKIEIFYRLKKEPKQDFLSYLKQNVFCQSDSLEELFDMVKTKYQKYKMESDANKYNM